MRDIIKTTLKGFVFTLKIGLVAVLTVGFSIFPIVLAMFYPNQGMWFLYLIHCCVFWYCLGKYGECK